MTKRTRLFLLGGTGILVLGLGTGLLASYMGGLQGLMIIGGDGPAELAYVPADSKMLAFASVRDVMQSEVRQRIRALQQGQGADRFQEETGIDIETDVDHVVAAASGTDATAQGPPLVIARGRFDQVRIEGLMLQRGGSVQTYRGVRLLTHPEGEFGLAFAEPGLVVIGAAAAVRQAIDVKAGTGNSVRSNTEVMRLVRDIQDGNAWAVARFDALASGERFPPELALQLPAINWLAARGYVNGGVRATLRAEARDEMAANDLRDVIRGFVALGRLQASQHPDLAGLMNSIELGGQGTTVSLGFAVPADLIGNLHFGALVHPPGPRPERQVGPDAPARPSLPEAPRRLSGRAAPTL